MMDEFIKNCDSTMQYLEDVIGELDHRRHEEPARSLKKHDGGHEAVVAVKEAALEDDLPRVEQNGHAGEGQCNQTCIMQMGCYYYRVTIQVVSNLPLTSKLRLRFDTWASYQNGTFVLMSTVGLTQPEWSPCIVCQCLTG